MIKNIKSLKENFLMTDIEKIDSQDPDLFLINQNIDSTAL